MSRSSPATASQISRAVISTAQRLRFYRRCFHQLDQHLLELQAAGSAPSDDEVRLLQAEINCLEEIIMLFTDISSCVLHSPKSAHPHPSQTIAAGKDSWVSDDSVPDGLDLSLVTDILMLSASSPWTVYAAECAQWKLCYVSPSVKRMLGWRPAELVGTRAWDGCHPDDVPALQRMLQLKGSRKLLPGNSVLYRKLRKDRSYARIQATGRAVGHSESAVEKGDMLKRTKSSQDDAGTMTSLTPSRPKMSNSGSQWHGQSVQLSTASFTPFSSKHEMIDIMKGKKVLLVEDDDVNRAIGKRLLESLKCKVTVSCNGKEALEILQQVSQTVCEDDMNGMKELPPPFDLVLMDLSMPVMDGTHAVQLFRDWEALEEPPRNPMLIFAVTSNVTDGDMVKCAQSGFDEFVDKPLTVDKLLDRLANRTKG